MFKCNKWQGLKISQNNNVKVYNSNKSYHIKIPCKYNIINLSFQTTDFRETVHVVRGLRGAALKIYISAVINKGVPLTLQGENISLK